MGVQSLDQEDPPGEKHGNTLSILPRESCKYRSLVGYGPYSHKESDMTEAT